MCKARRATVAAVGVRFTRHYKVFDRGRSLGRLGGCLQTQEVENMAFLVVGEGSSLFATVVVFYTIYNYILISYYYVW